MVIAVVAVVFAFAFCYCEGASAAIAVGGVTLPLEVDGRWIRDAEGDVVSLSCANWYGSDQKDYVVGGLEQQTVDAISSLIASEGFNCVRLPWSNEMFETNPIITNSTVLAANPSLVGKNALTIFDTVVSSLASQGLMIILDNHMSDSDWCCSDSDQNGLWYNDRYSEQKWLSDWSSLVLRYKSQPYVIGVDLRNELRSSTIGGKVTVPAWGTGATNDWARAATAGANTVLNVNPSLLIFVEGLNYALDLTKVATSPLTLSVPGRLIYSAHDYSWDHVTNSYSIFSSELDEAWGFIMKSNESYTAPIWLGEFGTCHSSSDCVDDTTGQGRWFQMIRQYITENTLNWGYWAIDGTQSSGTGRTYDAEESYGVLNMQWSGPASQDLLSALQEIML